MINNEQINQLITVILLIKSIMTSRRIDHNLDDLIYNLKLTKPNASKGFNSGTFAQNQDKTATLSITTDNQSIQARLGLVQSAFNKVQQPFWKQVTSHNIPTFNALSEYDSVVNDNYDDTNNYSFYQLKQQKPQQTQPQPQEFSFCQQFDSQISLGNNDDSLNRFSSIVDKLKTQGDQSDSLDGNYFYEQYKEGYSHQVSKTDRYMQKDQPYYSGSQTNPTTNRQKTQYFSGSTLKSTQKSYKSISKKSLQPLSFTKPKAQPIYAKLVLNHDKENNHQNSNICSKSSVISSLTTKKSNYSSAMKKPFNPTVSKTTVKPSQQCPISKVKVKELNEKIRKENQIIYASELKEKYQDVSPLQSFKKSTIQPHKFSSYKVKLFG